MKGENVKRNAGGNEAKLRGENMKRNAGEMKRNEEWKHEAKCREKT